MPPFYDGVSDALRRYVEVRFAWANAQDTSEELATAATTDAPGLRALLVECDLVRYALHDPGTEGATRTLDAAEQFVRESAG